ncbi:MAG: hypothetical protein Q7N87_02075 [Candidatus Uhrbacteria bacterium]|nr:hypothetical protein [Candidatus Uhrbacteria bacterium]
MNKYKITAQPLIGEGNTEYVVEADSEEQAKEIPCTMKNEDG